MKISKIRNEFDRQQYEQSKFNPENLHCVAKCRKDLEQLMRLIEEIYQNPETFVVLRPGEKVLDVRINIGAIQEEAVRSFLENPGEKSKAKPYFTIQSEWGGRWE